MTQVLTAFAVGVLLWGGAGLPITAAAQSDEIVRQPDPAKGERPDAKSASPFAGKELSNLRAAITGNDKKAAKEALRELRRRAGRKDVAAQMMVGDLYRDGVGVVHNYSLAALWYQKAARAGDGEANYRLSRMAAEGQGTPSSLKISKKWLMAAAEAGHEQARAELESMGIEPPPVKTDEKKEQKDQADGEADETVAAKDEPSDVNVTDLTGDEAGKKLEEMTAAAAGRERTIDRRTVAQRVDVHLVGMTLTKKDMDSALLDLASRFIAIVGARDLKGLKALTGPEVHACANDENKAGYDKYLSNVFRYPIPANAPLAHGTIDSDAGLPFGGTINYLARPTHFIRFDIPAANRRKGKTFQGGRTVLQYVVKTEAGWYLSLGCPTKYYLARLSSQ